MFSGARFVHFIIKILKAAFAECSVPRVDEVKRQLSHQLCAGGGVSF
jgi:hypothetical protein